MTLSSHKRLSKQVAYELPALRFGTNELCTPDKIGEIDLLTTQQAQNASVKAKVKVAVARTSFNLHTYYAQI